MSTPKEKLRIGLISNDKSLELQVKQAIDQAGGGYAYTSKDHLEMIQKLGVQKIHILLLDARMPLFHSQAQGFVNFFRSKRDYQNIPIGIYHDQPQFMLKALITDPKVRAVPSSSGIFLGIMNLLPIAQNPTGDASESLSTDFIQTEFLRALKGKIGEQASFSPDIATDDEQHASFLCQVSNQVRSHLAWIKIGARILETQTDGFSTMFKGISHDVVEELSENLMKQVVEDFQLQLELELNSRGALFFPDMEELSPQDRKLLYSRSKSTSYIFRSEQIAVLLELIRYL